MRAGSRTFRVGAAFGSRRAADRPRRVLLLRQPGRRPLQGSGRHHPPPPPCIATSGTEVRCPFEGLINLSSISPRATTTSASTTPASETALGLSRVNWCSISLPATIASSAGARPTSSMGGPGDDFMRTDAGRDRLLGGRGDDRLFGDADPDFFSGGPGDDFARGGAGTTRAAAARATTISGTDSPPHGGCATLPGSFDDAPARQPGASPPPPPSGGVALGGGEGRRRRTGHRKF